MGRRSLAFALLGLVLATPALAASTWQADVVVDHTAGASALTSHQVAVTLDTAALIAAGRLRPDAADLRFTDAAGTPLCHSIEHGLGGTATLVWVNVPAIPAHATTTIRVAFGDATAVSSEDPTCTFPYYDGFDVEPTSLDRLCGDVGVTIDDGVLALTWTGSGLVTGDVAFPVGEVHVAEARVLATDGAWPGLYWMQSGTRVSYGVLRDESQVRLGRSALGGDACFGHDWVSDGLPASDAAGVWQLVWAGTGSIAASVPGAGTLTSSDATWTRDKTLRFAFGGVATGSGTMLVDWVRTRRYTPTPPTTTVVDLRHACTGAPAMCDDGDACTTDVCAPLAGCLHTARTCADGAAWTADGCDPGAGCTAAPVACDDGDACTSDACDPATGCTTAAIGCDDGDVCTDDVCDAAAGCGHVPVRGPTFTGIRCGLDALQTSVDEPRSQAPPAVVPRLLRKARTLVERAAALLADGKLPQGLRRLRKAGVTFGRLAHRVRKLEERGGLEPAVASGWAADADALAAAIAGLRDDG